jgi:nitric oxide reductase NorQ protein
MMAPFYKEIGNEKKIFNSARERRLPILLKGPTGSGKSRFVEAMAHELNCEFIKVSCNEDTSASDLLGRFLLKGNETVWQDGPVVRAVKQGALLYLDEIAEAREDVIVVLHSLTDHRREIAVDRVNEVYVAPPGFMLVASFNPGYQSRLKELKPSTRQRFVTLEFNYPSLEMETEILHRESGCDEKLARTLAGLAKKIRSLDDLTLRETVSTRLLVNTAHLIRAGIDPRQACEVGIVNALTDEAPVARGLRDLCALYF